VEELMEQRDQTRYLAGIYAAEPAAGSLHWRPGTSPRERDLGTFDQETLDLMSQAMKALMLIFRGMLTSPHSERRRIARKVAGWLITTAHDEFRLRPTPEPTEPRR
jgi:hypothetical protein